MATDEKTTACWLMKTKMFVWLKEVRVLFSKITKATLRFDYLMFDIALASLPVDPYQAILMFLRTVQRAASLLKHFLPANLPTFKKFLQSVNISYVWLYSSIGRPLIKQLCQKTIEQLIFSQKRKEFRMCYPQP